MRRLTYEPNLQPVALVASDGESNRIVRPFFRQAQASRGVTQIAKVVHFLISRLRTFMARRAAMAAPSAAERQPRRMQPTAIFQLARRHKKWASHPLKLLLRDEGIVDRK